MYDDYKENARLYKDFTIQRTDPYGFWIILSPTGKVPKGLEENYTQPALAAKAIDIYLANQPKEVLKKK